MNSRLIIGFVASFVLLAGCTSGSGNELVGEVPGFESEDHGTVSGVVTNEELAPIVGARITLLEAMRTANTSEDGSFAVTGILPGTYQMFVEALGYQSVARRIDVVVGPNEPFRVTLEVLPVIEPYTELIIYRGFSICDFNAVYLSLTLALPGCGGKATIFETPVVDTWRYGVVEMRWQAPESMNLVSDNDDTTCLLDNSNPCFVWKIGRSPLRFDAAPLDQNFSRAPGYLYPAEAFNWVIAAYSAGMFQEEIQRSGTCLRPGEPPCSGVGMSLGTAFDLYVSMFHNEAPSDPTAYSAVPDG
jgi:hypothetical protein